QQQLAGAPLVLELPTDRARPSVQRHNGGSYVLELPRAISDRLRSLARHEGCSLFMALLAAFGIWRQPHAGSHDVLIGTPVANRGRLETEDIVGCFVNTVVLRLRLHGNPTIRALLARVRDVALEAFAHETMPFEQVVDAVQTWRDPSRPPLVQVMFVLQNA